MDRVITFSSTCSLWGEVRLVKRCYEEHYGCKRCGRPGLSVYRRAFACLRNPRSYEREKTSPAANNLESI